MLESGDHLGLGQRSETEPCASRLQRRDDFRQVVTDQTEPSVLGELLDHWREREREGEGEKERVEEKWGERVRRRENVRGRKRERGRERRECVWEIEKKKKE